MSTPALYIFCFVDRFDFLISDELFEKCFCFGFIFRRDYDALFSGIIDGEYDSVSFQSIIPQSYFMFSHPIVLSSLSISSFESSHERLP